jgi:hypothetical protein
MIRNHTGTHSRSHKFAVLKVGLCTDATRYVLSDLSLKQKMDLYSLSC